MHRRVHGGDVVVAETEAVHRAGLGVLGEDVEVRREPQQEVAAGRLLAGRW